jgi:SAM-dependent methyltransferase
MPIFAALGAECHVLDYSTRQIESENRVAAREGYTIHAVRADMTLPLPYPDESFDLIFHPVSNCYIEDVLPVWKECHRVLKRGGRLLAGLDNGLNFLVDEDRGGDRVTGFLPFNPLKNPQQRAELEAADCGLQFSHTIEEQIGGQLKAGFRLLDVYSDTNASGPLKEHGAAAFWATLACRET